jgi:hypothetical protein
MLLCDGPLPCQPRPTTGVGFVEPPLTLGPIDAAMARGTGGKLGLLLQL